MTSIISGQSPLNLITLGLKIKMKRRMHRNGRGLRAVHSHFIDYTSVYDTDICLNCSSKDNTKYSFSLQPPHPPLRLAVRDATAAPSERRLPYLSLGTCCSTPVKCEIPAVLSDRS